MAKPEPARISARVLGTLIFHKMEETRSLSPWPKSAESSSVGSNETEPKPRFKKMKNRAKMLSSKNRNPDLCSDKLKNIISGFRNNLQRL